MSVPARPSIATERAQPPILQPGYTYASIGDSIGSIVLTRRTPLGWYLGFSLAFSLLMLLMFGITVLLVRGIGI
jgi:molybdopterin-containing oxidoreductase family membrane subunit